MSKLSLTSNKTVRYNDLYLRIALCLIASHILIVYGERLTAFEMMLLPQYYYAVLSSAAIALLVFSVIRSIVIILDRKFPWNDLPVQRLGMQFFFGLLFPAIIVFLLVAAYFWIRGYNILKTNYLRYDFQVVLMQLILINLYYVAYYFYEQLSHTRRILSDVLQNNDETRVDVKETFTVNKADRSLIIHIDEIAYFFRDEDNNYLRTVTGEDYFVNSSLDEVQQQLPAEKFFRANRQLIVHQQACKEFNLLQYGKLAITLAPALSNDAVVSQRRARDFKAWLDK